ncbi:hypothetical protein R6Z07F_014764 [Ovis aries]
MDKRLLALLYLAHAWDVLENAFAPLLDEQYNVATKRVRQLPDLDPEVECLKAGTNEDTEISEASAQGGSEFTRRDSARWSAGLWGIPAHLVIPAGESPPPVPVTPGREFPPLASTRGRESPPTSRRLGRAPAPRSWESRARSGLSAPVRAARGSGAREVAAAGTRRAGDARDCASRGRGRAAVRRLSAGAAVAAAVAAAAAAAWGPIGRRLGPDTRGAASAEPRAGLQPARPLCPRDSPGKNTGVGCHALLQGIFLIQGPNLCLLHWQEEAEQPGGPDT